VRSEFLRRRRAPATAVTVLLVAALTAACGSSSRDGAAGGDAESDAPQSATVGGEAAGEAGPVVIEHAFGETEVPEDPQRVVTWGWGSADAALAMGVAPVAMSYQAYGGDDEGVLPWVREYVDAEGLEMPDVLPDSQEAPVEAIAAARPDLILAPYSGLTDAEYEQLSQVAPTVAYPEEAWATPWRDTIEIVGEALGRPDEARAVLVDIDARIEAAATAHPEFEGLSVAQVFPAPDAFYVYKPADPRVGFTLDLGFQNAASVDRLSQGDETFYYTLSSERLAELDSDVLVVYADSRETSADFLASPQAALMGQVERDAVAEVVGTELVASVSPPTALSLTWGLDDYVAELAEAAAASAVE
jgi:iron complex transport system substrate-binding protein